MHTSHTNKITQEVDFYIMEYIFIMHRCGFVSASMEEAEVIYFWALQFTKVFHEQKFLTYQHRLTEIFEKGGIECNTGKTPQND